MDLSKKTALSKSDQFEISSVMHALILKELFNITDWISSDIIFHGGTSLAIIRNSKRFSEDLDFMISDDNIKILDSIIEKIRIRMELAMDFIFPDGKVSVKGPKGDEVSKWEFKWEHPNKHGKVMIKTEFLVTKKSLLNNYKSTHLIPTQNGIVDIDMPIPVPEFISAWSDKIKAIATRPDFKWRDAYDLAWVINQIKKEDNNFVENDYIESLVATAEIYGKNIDDIKNGLENILNKNILNEIDSFEKDMSRWFSDDMFSRLKQTDQFKNILKIVKNEIQKVLAFIENYKYGVNNNGI